MACLTPSSMTRRFVRRLALVLTGSLLFMQLALAAYVCPVLPTTGTGGHDAVAAHPCGDPLGAGDSALPSLCAEHCKADAQSDQVPTPVPPLAQLFTLYHLAPRADGTPPPRPAAAGLSALIAATPPHAILHCVRRT